MGADCFLGNFIPAGRHPFTWMEEAMEGVGELVGQMMESEAGREPEDDVPRRRAISMEDLWRKYPSRGPSTLIEMDTIPEEQEKLAKGIKSTKL